MKRLVTSAAVFGLTASMAMAQTALPSGSVRVDDIKDGDIYSIQTGIEQSTFGNATYTQISTDWDDIGEIEDVVLSDDGQMIGIIAEVGGILGLGDKDVFLPTDAVRLIPGEDGRYAYVTRLSLEELKALPDADR
ncbi:PRC-barrel domain-containing protein [Falsirhodobacter halotolerans]|uniref:PRC-barrel domain-containing protein n=1 Tax=Falsirhodobacter halotolerans TaxID=1146892 RepID=UPI001FCFC926|nr:PRC-barrel domain-containing protein [Falsirhodobacter halotolerans]MCJ8139052.1 PRC-barrel domain-containing protein [Falsirhodobacter halotolerans]